MTSGGNVNVAVRRTVRRMPPSHGAVVEDLQLADRRPHHRGDEVRADADAQRRSRAVEEGFAADYLTE